jgi:hypothetical protein
MNNNNNNFTIRDNASEFARIPNFPKKWIEPLTNITRIKGYEGIDEYILNLIRGRMQMFLDSSDTVEWEEFQMYMHNTIIKCKDVMNPWTHASTTDDYDVEEEKEVKDWLYPQMIEAVKKVTDSIIILFSSINLPNFAVYVDYVFVDLNDFTNI